MAFLKGHCDIKKVHLIKRNFPSEIELWKAISSCRKCSVCCLSYGRVSPSLPSFSDLDEDLRRSKDQSYCVMWILYVHQGALFSLHGSTLQWSFKWNNSILFSAPSQQPLLDSGLGLVGDQSKIPSRNLNQVSLLHTLIQRFEPWLYNYSNLTGIEHRY